MSAGVAYALGVVTPLVAFLVYLAVALPVAWWRQQGRIECRRCGRGFGDPELRAHDYGLQRIRFRVHRITGACRSEGAGR